jgi:hypothetical protein
MFNFELILGLKVKHLKGNPHKQRVKYPKVELAYILFDDGKTFIELQDQCYIDFHDCDTSAKTLSVVTDAGYWAEVSEYPDATEDV